MPLDPQRPFMVHIIINGNAIILNDECTSDDSILNVKKLLNNQLTLKNDINEIILKYNGNIMENNKTLGYYGIVDEKHLILCEFSTPLIVPDMGARRPSNSNPNSFVQALDAKLTNSFRSRMSNASLDSFYGITNSAGNAGLTQLLRQTSAQPRSKCCDRTIGTLFIIFYLLFIAANIGHIIALKFEYNIYNNHIQNTTDLENTCPGHNFKRNISADLLIGFIINTSFIGIFIGFICCVICVTAADNGNCSECCEDCIDNITTKCGIDEECCGVSIIGCWVFIMFGLYVTIAVYNSIILFEDIIKIIKYCDGMDNDFYNKIHFWSIFNYVNTFISYSLFPSFCILVFISWKRDW